MIHIDRFGNLITDLSAAGLPQIASLELGLELGEAHIQGPLRESYAARPVGSLLLVAGSTGLLEVSVNQGNAQERLGARCGHPVEVHPERGGASS